MVKSKRKECFQDQINKHIRKNFRYPVIAQEMGIQGRVYVNFIISKDGSISDVIMRGPDKNLEKKADRIISKLPSMTPGKQTGKAVRVPFNIPINLNYNNQNPWLKSHSGLCTLLICSLSLHLDIR